MQNNCIDALPDDLQTKAFNDLKDQYSLMFIDTGVFSNGNTCASMNMQWYNLFVRQRYYYQQMTFGIYDVIYNDSLSASVSFSLTCFYATMQTLEMLEKKEKVLLKKASQEVEKAKEFTRAKNKRGIAISR